MPVTDQDLQVAESTPAGIIEARQIILRLDVARGGVVVDYFPGVTGFTEQILGQFEETKGVVQLSGSPRVGTRITITCVNGEAVYELVERITLETGEKGYAARLRSSKAQICSTEVRTYDTLQGLVADEMPMYAGFTKRFLESPNPHISYTDPLLVVKVDGTTAEYYLPLKHPRRLGGKLGERTRLICRDGVYVTLPVATMRSRLGAVSPR